MPVKSKIEKKIKKKFNKNKVKTWFDRNFSFEKGVDLSDDVAVLYRKNVVIKNIIFVSNLIYSLILFIITIGHTANGNWLFAVIPFPLTFVINATIKKLINPEKHELIKQQVAMYLCSFYMFLVAIIIYIKLSISYPEVSEAAYMLIFYSLVVVSLYQDTNMLKYVFSWMAGIVTILHVTITYNIYSLGKDLSFLEFLKEFVKSNEFRDILLRTIIMLTFMFVVYIIVSINENMQKERNSELQKRKSVEESFTDVVSDLFQTMLKDTSDVSNDKDLELLSLMSGKLASLYGLSPERCNEVKAYATYARDNHISLDIKNRTITSDEEFIKLQKETEIGRELVRRFQLDKKCDDIVRAHIENFYSSEFQAKMLDIQNEIDSNIILLCKIYITLRNATSYKRPYPHKRTMEVLEQQFKIYFPFDLYERFIKFASDFEELYDNYE